MQPTSFSSPSAPSFASILPLLLDETENADKNNGGNTPAAPHGKSSGSAPIVTTGGSNGSINVGTGAAAGGDKGGGKNQ